MDSHGAQIRTTGLTKKYGSTKGLDKLTLSVTKGAIVGLVGPNGSGKSTALKILATVIRPTSGQASVCGYDVTKRSLQVRRVIGYVPEKVAIWDELNAYENLMYWGKIRGMDIKMLKPRIEELLKELGLADERKLTSKFSKGMKQRVALGMAILHSPDVIILDEPTTGLDPDGRMLLREMMLRQAGIGKTILLSTHELLEAGKICTEVIFMKQGIIRGSADPRTDDIEEKYRELMK